MIKVLLTQSEHHEGHTTLDCILNKTLFKPQMVYKLMVINRIFGNSVVLSIKIGSKGRFFFKLHYLLW